MSDEPADEKQVSVAELLARNGQQVGAAGGRRRRGVAGGISVAELTGEIPIITDEPQEEAPAPEPEVRPEPQRPEPHVREPQVREPQYRPRPAAEKPPADRPKPANSPQRAGSIKAPVWPTEGDTPHRPSVSTMDKSQTFAMAEIEDESTDTETTQLTETVKPVTPVAQPPVAQPSVAQPPVTSSPKTDPQATAQPVRPEAEPETEAVDEPETAPPARSGKRSPARQWLGIIGQGVVAVVLGALLFKGFERLWDVLPWVALVLAFFVIVGLVAVVRVLRRTDDIVSILLAVLVGGFVTLGPLAFILSTN